MHIFPGLEVILPGFEVIPKLGLLGLPGFIEVESFIGEAKKSNAGDGNAWFFRFREKKDH